MWAVDPNEVSVNWNEGGYIDFYDDDYTQPTIAPLLTLTAIPESRGTAMLLGGALCLLVAGHASASRIRRNRNIRA